MSPDHDRIEKLLAALAGVLSARIVTSTHGELEEIHILAQAEYHPKRIVRNVESALCAGFGIEFDRRIVSVATVREGVTLPPPRTAVTASASRTPTPAPLHAGMPTPRDRVVFHSFEARVDAMRRATCTVTLRADSRKGKGEGTGLDSVHGRAEAAAQATLAALVELRGPAGLGLDGVEVIELDGETAVLTAVRALDGRRAVELTGIAAIDDSPEEAAVLAVLQATNRWEAPRE